MTADDLKQMTDDVIARLLKHAAGGMCLEGTIRLAEDASVALTAYQSLTARLESQNAAQEVLIGEHIARSEQWRKDAERYRWLRNADPSVPREIDVCDDFMRIFEGKELDEAIDAALSAATEGGES